MASAASKAVVPVTSGATGTSESYPDTAAGFNSEEASAIDADANPTHNNALSAPPIEHITQNYISLHHLVTALVDKSIRQLQNVLRTLPAAPSDAARKRTLLQFIVGAREEFVKVFVLCKWAVIAPDISRAIDVAYWLRQRDFTFTSVVTALWHLQQSLGPAKMPWADLETALQVLRDGQPIPSLALKNHEWSPQKPLSPAHILQTLRRLDALLAVRLALAERLPSSFRKYSIKDGRARFTIAGSFWVALGVASESPDARFFFVDFGLLCDGTNPSKHISLGKKVKARIETAVNEQLTKKPLGAVLSWLQMFASVYRLRLLAAELTALESGLWAGVLQHKLHHNMLTVQFWTQRPEKHHELRISIGPYRQLITDVEPQHSIDMSTDGAMCRLLRVITAQKASELIAPLCSLPGTRRISDTELEIDVGSAKVAQVGVDVSSGLFVVRGGVPAPLSRNAQDALNGQGTKNAANTLAYLRIRSQQQTLASRAEAAGWNTLPSVRLGPEEWSKLTFIGAVSGSLASNASDQTGTVMLGLRRPEWAQGWFLCVVFANGIAKPVWLATLLTCHSRRWHMGPIHYLSSGIATSVKSEKSEQARELSSDQGLSMLADESDYVALERLAVVYGRRFALYELARALDSAGVRHTLRGESLLVDLTTIVQSSGVSEWAYSGLECCVSESEDCVIAKGHAKTGHIDALVGSTPGGCISVSAGGEFIIKVANLDRLQMELLTLHRAARSLALSKRLNLKVVRASLDKLELAYGPDHKGELTVKVLGGGDDGTLPVIEFATSNPQSPLSPFLPRLLSRVGLSRVVKFLSESFGLWEGLRLLTSKHGLVVLPQTASSVVVQKGTGKENRQLIIDFGWWRGQAQLRIQTKAVIHLPEVLPLGNGLAMPVSSCHQALEQLVANL